MTSIFFQEGKIRAKLAKMLKGKDGVHFENSFATGDGIKMVRHICHFY
jgi:ribosomal protein L13